MPSAILLLVVAFSGPFIGPVASKYDIDQNVYERDEQYVETSCQRVGNLDKTLKFVRGGLSEPFWSQLGALDESLGVSSQCLSDLERMSDGLSRGDRDHYTFLDASSSSPSALLDGTMANPGDYDLCIQASFVIDERRVRGSYCSFELHPQNTSDVSPDISLDNVSLFKHTSITQPLCLPDSCSSGDVYAMVKRVLSCNSFYLVESVICDSEASTGMKFKLEKAHIAQKLAMAVLAVYTLAFAWGNLRTTKDGSSGTAAWLSVSKNYNELFRVHKGETVRSAPLDILRAIYLYVGPMAHIVACLEKCRVVAKISNFKRISNALRWPIVQYSANEGTFFTLAFFSGISSFYVIEKSLKAGTSLVVVVLLKWLKYFPLLVALMVLELIWPLLFNGPNATIVGSLVVEHVVKYYWQTLTMVLGFVPLFSNDSVANVPMSYMFFSGHELWLLVLGAALVSCIRRNKKVGLALSLVTVLASNFILYQQSAKFKIIPHFSAPTSDPWQLVNYMTHIHMGFFTYVPSYVVALIGAYAASHFNVGFKRQSTVEKLWVVTFLLRFYALLGPVFYHSYQLIPLVWTPLYIVLTKSLILLRSSYEFFAEEFSKRHKAGESTLFYNWTGEKKAIKTVEEEDRFSLIRGIFRLGFSAYFINYWVVRTEFFTHRGLFYSSPYQTIIRIDSCLTLVMVAAFVFHMFIIAPFECLMKMHVKRKDCIN